MKKADWISRERSSGRRSLDTHTTLRKEERRTPGSEAQGVPLFGIPLQGFAGRGIEGNKARFSKLCLPNRQNPILKIDIGPVECQCFPRTEARGGKQSDESRIRQRTQSSKRSQSACFGHKTAYLRLREDVRSVASSMTRDQSPRRYLGLGIEGIEPGGEFSDHG